jgi:glycosyltransferase involved in cell wall biosynthesis
MQIKGKIKVLHILPFLNKGGGTERILFDLLSRINADIFEPVVCITHKEADPAQRSKFINAGIKVYELPKKQDRRKRFIGLLKYLRSDHYDIAHIHAYDGNENHARFACVLARVPAILTHDHRYAYWNDRPMLNIVWSLLNLFTYRNIAISGACGEFRRKCCLWQKDKVITINNGVDLNVFRPVLNDEKRKYKIRFGLNPDHFIVGAAGRLVEVKRFDLIIKAANLLELGKNIISVFAGEGPLEGELKELAEGLGSKNVVFLKWVNDIASFYKCLDAYVMSSEFHEGFGLVTAEAMASGVPVVAVNDTNHIKIIGPGHGIFVEPTPIGIAEGIMRIFDNKQLATALSERGRRRAEECFDIDRAVKELEEIYLSAIK